MRLQRTVLAVILIATACAGKKASRAPAAEASAGGSSAAASGSSSKVSASGMPAWVDRGSVAANDNGKRVFYGVASASGIKNPALLRSTADNRARNEIAKVFEVFTASLMKDYSASSGEQSVEQAVKTMTSMSLEGTEVIDRYIGKDGTMYSLAALDLQKFSEAIAKAKELGAVKSYTTKVSVDDIFDQHGKKEPPPTAVIATSDSAAKPAGTAAAPKEASSNTKTRKDKPAWVDGSDPNYPAAQYLCAVGYANERSAAEGSAYAGLAKVFVARIESVSRDFMAAYASTGAKSLDVQSSENLNKVSTEKVFTGVQIYEVWDKKGTTYALACLDRPKTAQTLRDQISEADGKIGKCMERAGAADKAKKVTELSRALDSIVEREALNGELRIVDPRGIGEEGQYSHADVASAFDEAVGALRVGIKATGSHSDEFRRALMEGLVSRGWSVLDLGEDDDSEEPLDVEIAATIKMENATTEATGGISYVRAVIQVDLKNVAKKKVMSTLSESRREGHKSLPEAERRAVRELAKILINKVGGEIDAKMKGK